MGHQLETGKLSSFTIYAPKNVSQEEIIKEAFDKCDMARKKEYKFKLAIQSREKMWFEDLPYEMQQKFGACYKTTLSYLPTGIKCWKRVGRRSWDMLVPRDFSLDRGRRIQWEKDVYFENWQIAKDTFFGNESEALKLRRETIAKEKEDIRLAKEKESAAIRQAHQEEVDTYNEKYRLFRGETKEEYYKHPLLGDAYIINSYMTPELYTEERFKGMMRFIDEQIEKQAAKEKAEAERKMWIEKIDAKLDEKPDNGGKSLRERANDLGYEVRYWDKYASVAAIDSICISNSVEYSDRAVVFINQFITQKEIERKKQLEAEQQKQVYEQQKAYARELGLPTDIRVWYRVGASTNCGNGWVIKPDGSFREPTVFDAVKRYGDGYKNWEQIFPGEVVLSWAKGSAAANHEFEVLYMPKEGLTTAQKEAVLNIEEDIQEAWKDKKGFSSGIFSPDVGMGWNIAGRKVPLQSKEEFVPVKVKDDIAPEVEKNVMEDTPDRPIEDADLARLLEAFGRCR